MKSSPATYGRSIATSLLAFALLAPPLAAQAPARTFDVRAFGATGDGHTIDSDAINRAIDSAAAAGGGTVHFPAGTYASHSVRLRSHVALHLERGATLLAADTANGRGFDPAEPGAGNAYQDFGHSHWHNSLLWGEDVEDVSIVGPGRIDGAALRRELSRDVPGLANKAIALKRARNVLLRDLTIYRGGHFGILATGVDNLTIDDLTIDTNRDGIDVDACRNVRISNTSVNAPNDDAIVLKSSYALGAPRATEDVAITNSVVSGFDVGSVLDGTYRRTTERAPDRDGPTGRIKLGTESNGAFRNITIANVVFERSRGLALETVDGATIEDVAITNVTMREVTTAPIFLRIGARLRGPAGTQIGAIRRVTISNVVASGADPRYASIIAGLPGHPVEDVTLRDVRLVYRGGLSLEHAAKQPSELVNTFFRPPDGSGPREPFTVPERAAMYPEPSMFGVLPAYGFYVRHARGVRLDGVQVSWEQPDTRPAFVLDDVRGVDLRGVRARRASGASLLELRGVEDVRVRDSAPLADVTLARVARKSY
ncbi:glycoside hydrolase family protein (plasmid) [Gemmatirosa kalamazoonensis]|uniref:Glycoside hydrolase family protein n=1 Tax=Gemmatirosa kalamazoonensis TaxID=861299 RepID=W0RQD2_9BACT|nr:glycosyl hydrolase family 28-related protein [Gemmatirosa kalamazoonensis]AHG93184.1 glycoside hydrolase family protein [Gemmatirosa kalamazoonensis]